MFRLILTTARIRTFLFLCIAILFTLQWLFNIDQLTRIVLGNSGLSFGDRINFLFEGFINIFRYGNNFIPLAMIFISLMQAASLTLLIHFRGVTKLRKNQSIPLGLSMLGVGCVACGGSILTPVLALVATNVSIGFAESVSRLLLLVAIIISYMSMNKISFYVAQAVAE